MQYTAYPSYASLVRQVFTAIVDEECLLVRIAAVRSPCHNTEYDQGDPYE